MRLLPAALLSCLLPGGFQDEPAAGRIAALIRRLGGDLPEDREAAGEALYAVGTAARSALERAAADPDPEVAARARLLVRRIALKERGLTPALLEAVPGAESRLLTQGEAAWAGIFLEAWQAGAADAELMGIAGAALAGTPEHGALRAICAAVEQRGLRGCAPALADLLKHSGGDVRAAAARAIGGTGTPEGQGAVLRALLKDPYLYVRGEAARALGRLGVKEAREALAAAASEDPQSFVRERAREALEALR
jgi:hypothetical protein